ncbi:hypothetical protein Droror1_Dr00016078 [Drosera rotundifolia]
MRPMHILSTAGLRHTPPLRRRLLHSLPRHELITRICRLVLHHRAGSITKLPFTFSEDLIVDVLCRLKLNPDASLSFFKLAQKQQQFGAGLKSMAMIVHILSRARNYEETRSYLNEIVGFSRKRGCEVCVVWGELVRATPMHPCYSQNLRIATPYVLQRALKIFIRALKIWKFSNPLPNLRRILRLLSQISSLFARCCCFDSGRFCCFDFGCFLLLRFRPFFCCLDSGRMCDFVGSEVLMV